MRRSLLGMFCIALLSLAIFAAGSSANSGCNEASGTGHTAKNESGAVIGSATLTINGEARAATVTRTTSEEPGAAAEDGSKEAQTSHRFDFGDGNSITTSDRVRLIPAENPRAYSLISISSISEGTGSYEGVRGQMMIKGDSNSDMSEVSWELRGNMCGK